MLSHNFIRQITLPTRVTDRISTLIDNILTNSYENKCTSGNITTSISDHLPQFLFIENVKGQTFKIKNPKVTVRDYKILIVNLFKVILKKSTGQ